jgi:hypothetical protein
MDFTCILRRTSVLSAAALMVPCHCHLQAVDFNSDGHTDLIWRAPAADLNRIWFLPELRWFDSYLIPTGTNTVTPYGTTNFLIATTADFDRDAYTDLLWRNPTSGSTLIWFMTNGVSPRDTCYLGVGGTNWYVVGAGDFTGDGYPDILWREPTLDLLGVWYIRGTNGWSGGGTITQQARDPLWRAAAVGDFNHDGWPDIWWENGTYYQTAIWYLNGLNFIASARSQNYSAGWATLGLGEFNVVGNPEVVWRHTNSSTALWVMNGTGGTNYVRSVLFPNTGLDWLFGGSSPGPNVLELSATNVTSTNSFMLTWRLGDGLPVTVQRREHNPANPQPWSILVTNYFPMRLTNTDLLLGQRYEYIVTNTYSHTSEYLLTAINGTPVEHRGAVILVVANDITNALNGDLETLHTNLVGDGWTVIRTNVPPHDDSSWTNNTNAIVWIKNFITNAYYASPETNKAKAVILVGHVPVPHSGSASPDTHGYRCLPADMYYGDVDGAWTDINPPQPCWLTFYCTNTLYGSTPDCSCGECDAVRHDNLPGDGKWDQNRCPVNGSGESGYELYVGRIDCRNLTAFTDLDATLVETNLLRRYLRKNDRYRNGLTALVQKVVTGSYFHTNNQYAGVYQQGLRIGSRLFGSAPEVLINADPFYPSNPSTWAVMGGYGQAHHIEGYGSLFHAAIAGTNQPASDYTFIAPNTEPQGGFYCLYGSCFVDHFYANNLLRSLVVAGTNFNLGAMWFNGGWSGLGLYNQLEFEEAPLGETVGSGFLRTLNDIKQDIGYYNVYQAWIGDPTLRVQISLTPTSLVAVRTNATNVVLNWTGSAEPSQYYVYRSTNGLDGWFTRIAANPIGTTTYTETNAPSGALYMVRGLNVKSTASGSYTNLSQGIFAHPN